MRAILHGYTVDLQTWESLLEYAFLHEGVSVDDALDALLARALREADKATATIPLELLQDLVECAEKLAAFTGISTPDDVVNELIRYGASTAARAQEFLPVMAVHQWEDVH